MIKLSVYTKLDRKEIIDKAIEYFSNKEGLKIIEQEDCCVMLEGTAPGYVRVDLVENEKTEVIIESREYEYQAKKFAEQL